MKKESNPDSSVGVAEAEAVAVAVAVAEAVAVAMAVAVSGVYASDTREPRDYQYSVQTRRWV